MNTKVLVVLCIVLVVVTMMMMEGAEARRRCRRKCRFRCKVRCRWSGRRLKCKPYCKFYCKFHCRGRDEPEPMALEDENDPVSLPSSLNDYDENKDGKISLNEFRNVIPTDDNEGFSALDKNGDYFISCDEFMASDLEFGGNQPTC